ncbi:MAG: endonuclease VII domain-containing protein [Chloroflexi bacterium]|nr:endonuclease VII domain-containing protein [Chloroflexota bacterium]
MHGRRKGKLKGLSTTREDRADPRKEKAYQLFYHYGITLEEYDAMVKKQKSVCAICKRAPDPHKRQKALFVDHDHATGRVRGLLCNKCNTSLGGFSDSPFVLRAALDYLEENR